MRKMSFCVSETKQAILPQKMARLEISDLESRGMVLSINMYL